MVSSKRTVILDRLSSIRTEYYYANNKLPHVITVVQCFYSHAETEDAPLWLLWLRGGGLVAAVLYTATAVSLAMGWQGWQNIVMCGTMVRF